MGRAKKLTVAKLDAAASTAVDNTTLTEATNASLVVGSPVTRASKKRAGKDLPESSNPSGGNAKMKKIAIEESHNEEQLVENLGVVEKLDFLVQSVKEFSSKGIKLLNEDQALEFNYKSQYLASQKMVKDLTKENQGLSVKLASALAKLEAYEQMNALGQMKEMMYASNMTKATETFINFTSQLTSGQGTTSTVIALPSNPAAAEPNAPVLQETSGQGTVAAEQTSSLPQATTGQGTTSTVSAKPELGRSKRTVKKKVPSNL